MEREKAEVNKQFVLRALTDPEFRERLAAGPERALGRELSEVNQAEARFVLATVAGIEAQIAAIGDMLLCVTNGDPCGIAVT